MPDKHNSGWNFSFCSSGPGHRTSGLCPSNFCKLSKLNHVAISSHSGSRMERGASQGRSPAEMKRPAPSGAGHNTKNIFFCQFRAVLHQGFAGQLLSLIISKGRPSIFKRYQQAPARTQAPCPRADDCRQASRSYQTPRSPSGLSSVRLR